MVYSINATIASTYGDARPSAEDATNSNFFIVCRNRVGNIVSQIPVYIVAYGK